jgi:N-acetylmuramoyl-L-alanine amidase
MRTRLVSVLLVVAFTAVGALADAPLGATPPAASPVAAATTTAYVVRRADTLSGLAAARGTDVATVASLNPGLTNRSKLRIGQRLVLPLVDHSRRLPLVIRTHADRLRLRRVIRHWAKRNAIPADLVEATLYLESGWNQTRVSSTGAVGVGQLMPGTESFIKRDLIGRAAGGGGLSARRAEDNIRMSARYLRFLLRSTGSETRALHAYYQGSGSIAAHGLYDDTRAYASAIQRLRARFRADALGI